MILLILSGTDSKTFKLQMKLLELEEEYIYKNIYIRLEEYIYTKCSDQY